MPTYEFRCPNGHEFERFYKKISDAQPEAPCPVCGAAAERLVSGGAGLLFKGSGFYLTDYGRNAHRKGSSGGSGGSEGGSGGAGGAGGASSAGGSESKGSESKSTGSTPKPPESAPARKPGGSKDT